MTPSAVVQIRKEAVTLEEDLVPTGKPIREDVSPYVAVQPLERDLLLVFNRGWRERICSRPWRPFHHHVVHRYRRCRNVDVKGVDGGLDVRIYPGQRPAREYEIDPERFVLELALLASLLLGAVYLLAVAPW